MAKFWYGRMIGMCQYGFGLKWFIGFFRFPNGVMLNQYILHIWWNGEIIIWRNGDMVKFSNGESFFWGHISINGEMVKRWNSICALEWFFLLEWIFSPGMLSWGTIVAGDNFFFLENYPGGHVPGYFTGSFCPQGQHLTTLDTLLGRKLSREMSSYKLVLLYLLWYRFD